jgi:hypothetical protein
MLTFKVGDKVVIKLDIWNELRTLYTNCGLNLPEEPPIFNVHHFNNDGTCFCYASDNRLGISFNLEDLLKAP